MKNGVRLITIFVIALALVIPFTSASGVSMFKFKGLGPNASTSVLPLTEKELAQS